MTLQTVSEANVRGQDINEAETTRAKDYCSYLVDQANNRLRLVNMLTGDSDAYDALQRRMLARTASPPPYCEV